MTNIRLSHSAATTYQTCGQKYKYHYINKIREVRTSAALLFGSALDSTVQELLKDHKENTLDSTYNKYIALFKKNWTFGTINNKLEPLKENLNLVYSYSDFDKTLLEFNPQFSNLTRFNLLTKQKKEQGIESFKEDDLKYYNSVNWECLLIKGQILLNGFIQQILPKIKKVLSIQKEISLVNENGDTVIGFIDFIVEWVDGRVIIFDLKTSSIEYEYDAVKTSQQLTLYKYAVKEEYKTNTAGYIVLRKGIRKEYDKICQKCGHLCNSRALKCDTKDNSGNRCSGEWLEKIRHEATINILIDDISDNVETMVIENFNNINKLIKTGVFTRNLGACDSPFPCAYKNLCFKNDKSGLDFTNYKE